MKRTMRRSIVIFVSYLLLLCILSVPVLAWEWPCPNECYYWTGYNCILTGDCGVADPCPGECCECVDCSCDPNDSECGDPNCWNCVSCECECDITINSVSSDDYACIDCNVTFTASVAGSCSCVDWSGGGDPNSKSDSCGFTTRWDTPGVKTVTATPDCGSSKQKQVTIVKVDRIEINYSGASWDDVTGETIYVLKGTKYTFKAFPDPSGASWPAGSPVWSGVASGTGETIEVTFDSSGTKTLTAKCQEGIGGCGSDPGKSVTINVVVPEPDQIYFVDYTIGEEHNIYNVTDPVWKRVSNPDDPASYTKNKYVRVRAKFWASENLTYNTQVYVDVAGVGWLTFTEDTSENFWSWPSESTFHNSEGLLEDTIGSIVRNFAWYYKVPSGTNQWIAMASQSGPHKIYRVYGAPECGDSDYTEGNLDGAVGKALGESTESGIASKANDNVGDALYSGCICDGGFQKNFDAAMDSYPPSGDKGLCCCRAEGLNCVLQVLGIGPYTHVYVNERPEPGLKTVSYTDYCPTCDEDVRRMYWSISMGAWNNWEGAMRCGGAGTTCYAPSELTQGGVYDEGTYSGFQTKIADDYGYSWVYYPYLETSICTHLAPP